MTLCNKTGYDMECNFIMSIPWIIVLQITGAYENTFGIFFPFFFFAYEHSLCNQLRRSQQGNSNWQPQHKFLLRIWITYPLIVLVIPLFSAALFNDTQFLCLSYACSLNQHLQKKKFFHSWLKTNSYMLWNYKVNIDHVTRKPVCGILQPGKIQLSLCIASVWLQPSLLPVKIA